MLALLLKMTGNEFLYFLYLYMSHCRYGNLQAWDPDFFFFVNSTITRHRMFVREDVSVDVRIINVKESVLLSTCLLSDILEMLRIKVPEINFKINDQNKIRTKLQKQKTVEKRSKMGKAWAVGLLNVFSWESLKFLKLFTKFITPGIFVAQNKKRKKTTNKIGLCEPFKQRSMLYAPASLVIRVESMLKVIPNSSTPTSKRKFLGQNYAYSCFICSYKRDKINFKIV